MYVCVLHVFMYVCVCVCVCMHMYVHVCMCVCVYVCMYMYVMVSYSIFLGRKTVCTTLQNFVVLIAAIVATFVHAIV